MSWVVYMSACVTLVYCGKCFNRSSWFWYHGYHRNGGWWRWALASLHGVAPIRIVGVSASVNLPLHHKFQKFSSGTGSPRWSRKKGHKMVVVVVCGGYHTVELLWIRWQPTSTCLTQKIFDSRHQLCKLRVGLSSRHLLHSCLTSLLLSVTSNRTESTKNQTCGENRSRCLSCYPTNKHKQKHNQHFILSHKLPPFYDHYTGQHVLDVPPLRTGGLCWSKVLLSACHC